MKSVCKRCSWVNLNNKLYVDYHDFVWGVPCHDDLLLFKYLILEMFQAGLTWELIINKKKSFEEAFSYFNYEKVALYDDSKIEELMNNKNIIRNRLKIESSINNAKVFINIIKEYGSFDKYIWHFTKGRQIHYKRFHSTSSLSDKVSKDLKNRGMKFIGSTIIYSYLEAIGVLNNHEDECFKGGLSV